MSPLPHSRLTRVSAFAAVVAIVTLFSSGIGAYTTYGSRWLQPPVAYLINPANQDLPEAVVETAVRAGADAWGTQSGASFAFVYAGRSTQTAIGNDGSNLVVFRNASSGAAIATTYYWSSGGRLIDADIVFWDAAFRFFAGSSGCSGGVYIEDVAAHEFGHALGLGHSSVAGTTMWPSVTSCTADGRTLAADDIAGVLSLYPAALSAPRNLRVVR